MTNASMTPDFDSRHSTRCPLHLTVDLKSLKTQDVDNILFGQGFEDLNLNSLSLARPRHGMERAETLDISLSGMRLSGPALAPGTAAVLDLHLPHDRVVVKALVEVVWSSQHEGQATLGCRFAAIQEHGVERMRVFLRPKN